MIGRWLAWLVDPPFGVPAEILKGERRGSSTSFSHRGRHEDASTSQENESVEWISIPSFQAHCRYRYLSTIFRDGALEWLIPLTQKIKGLAQSHLTTLAAHVHIDVTYRNSCKIRNSKH